MPYGTVPTQEGAPFMVRRDGDDYSAVEAGSVASSNSDEKTADGPDNHNEMVVCPYLFEDLDALLTRPSGSPTPLSRAAQVGSVGAGLACVAGTFCTPGLLDAWAANDPLLALALASLFVCSSVVAPLLLEEVRVAIRGAAGGGKLVQLGAGTTLIPVDRARVLQQPPSAKVVFIMIVLWTTLCGPFIYTGWGLQLPTQNRLTAAVFILCLPPLATILPAGPAALRTASTLIGARIRTVSQAAKAEAETDGQDVGPE
eukprot:COSAG02_NODE_15789_length_1141_cov_0.864683_1_plen_256_part_10